MYVRVLGDDGPLKITTYHVKLLDCRGSNNNKMNNNKLYLSTGIQNMTVQ